MRMYFCLFFLSRSLSLCLSTAQGMGATDPRHEVFQEGADPEDSIHHRHGLTLHNVYHCRGSDNCPNHGVLNSNSLDRQPREVPRRQVLRQVSKVEL